MEAEPLANRLLGLRSFGKPADGYARKMMIDFTRASKPNCPGRQGVLLYIFNAVVIVRWDIQLRKTLVY